MTTPTETEDRFCTNLSAQEVLGHEVRDIISGFQGRAVGHVIYISGCNQVLVSPPYDLDESKWPKATWLDDQRLIIVEGSVQIKLDNTKKPGHDIAPPTK